MEQQPTASITARYYIFCQEGDNTPKRGGIGEELSLTCLSAQYLHNMGCYSLVYVVDTSTNTTVWDSNNGYL